MPPKTYSPPHLNKKTMDGVNRGDFDFLMPLHKELWRTDEVATAIGRSVQYVRLLRDDGRLEVHQDSARGERKTDLITRRSVLLYLVETANYDPAFIVIRIEAVTSRLPAHTLDRLIATLRRQRERLS